MHLPEGLVYLYAALRGRKVEAPEWLAIGKMLRIPRLALLSFRWQAWRNPQDVAAWFKADDLTVTRYAMYDRAGRRLKELLQSDFRPVGAIPTAFHLEIRNEQTSGTTIVDMSEVQYDTGLDDELVSQRALERGP